MAGSLRTDPRAERISGEDENLTIWSDNETAHFLRIWRRPDVQTALRQYTRKRPIWKKVSTELAAEGYRRSAEQCKSKMHNLMTSYRRVKKGVDPESRCKFFAIIDEVMATGEFDSGASAAPGGAMTLAAETGDLDGVSSEESGPSTSGYSDNNPASHPQSLSVSPGSRDESWSLTPETTRPGPWRPVPLHASGDTAGHVTAPRDRGRQLTVEETELDQPPRKRYCKWEERRLADVKGEPSGRGGSGYVPDDSEGTRREPPYLNPLPPAAAERFAQRPEHHPFASDEARDLRVRMPAPPTGEDEQRLYSAEARDLITAHARQLLSVLPGHPALRMAEGSNEPSAERPSGQQQNGVTEESSGPAAPSGDERSISYLERMETLLQELVDMQRAFLISEERRRREQLIREENWRIQDKEFLLRLAQTLANQN